MYVTYLVLGILMVCGVITNIKIMGTVFICLSIVDFTLTLMKEVCNNIQKKKEEGKWKE